MTSRTLDNEVKINDVHNFLLEQDVAHNLIFNCRVFDDPEGRENLSGHIGFHPEIIVGLFRGRSNELEGRAIFAGYKYFLDALLQKRAERARVIVYCDSGVHRSVAMTYVLSRIALKVGIIVDPATHWSQYWQQQKRCQRIGRDSCLFCNWHITRRDEVFEELYQIYEEVQACNPDS